MTKITIEINDTKDEICAAMYDDLQSELQTYWDDNQDEDLTVDCPDSLTDLDNSGTIHEIIDSSVPVYDSDIEDLFYLYGNDIEEAFDNAGIGSKEDSGWPCGWKMAAIYCWLEVFANEWYEDRAEDLWEEWTEEAEAKSEE